MQLQPLWQELNLQPCDSDATSKSVQKFAFENSISINSHVLLGIYWPYSIMDHLFSPYSKYSLKYDLYRSDFILATRAWNLRGSVKILKQAAREVFGRFFLRRKLQFTL
jgi:hypothetical protein